MYPMSATQIGRKIGGLGAAETNLLLKERGFLEGEACDYWPTEKGEEFTTIESFHAGTGGAMHSTTAIGRRSNTTRKFWKQSAR